MTANESEIGGTPGCNYSDVETETHTHTRRGHKYDTGHAAESSPFSVPHECLRWATNLSCRNSSNKAERYMQEAPAETKAMKCNQRQRERSHTIILPHAPLNQCCFSQTGDLLASKYSTASLPRIQVQWNNQLWFRGEGFLYGAGYFLCCREKHAKRMDQWQRLL